jgi:hypothetical protein
MYAILGFEEEHGKQLERALVHLLVDIVPRK